MFKITWCGRTEKLAFRQFQYGQTEHKSVIKICKQTPCLFCPRALRVDQVNWSIRAEHMHQIKNQLIPKKGRNYAWTRTSLPSSKMGGRSRWIRGLGSQSSINSCSRGQGWIMYQCQDLVVRTYLTNIFWDFGRRTRAVTPTKNMAAWKMEKREPQ